jgi:16S rRNA (guanine527-N7)-methyltransferase
VIGLEDDRARALALRPVSHETLLRLDRYVLLLRRWQKIKNLVGPRTLDEIWTRHVVDSLQLLDYGGGAKIWCDLGSGAGLPGLVLAAALVETPGARVHCVESNRRKAAFLREAARDLDVPVVVHDRRAEDVVGELEGIEIVTARALAPLGDLLDLAAILLKKNSVGLFLKGQDVDRELTEAAKSWTFKASVMPSVTDPSGRVVRVERASPRNRTEPARHD